uniref:Secreted protein n=1 Tax=Globodera pallida TaxID=36090 RepID=A0A183C9D7_GLOPA
MRQFARLVLAWLRMARFCLARLRAGRRILAWRCVAPIPVAQFMRYCSIQRFASSLPKFGKGKENPRRLNAVAPVKSAAGYRYCNY